MKIEEYLASNLEWRIDQKFFQKMELGKSLLFIIKEVFLEVALENIIETGNNDNLVDDFAFLLDHFEEISDLILIRKVQMYNTYIRKLTEYFNMCYKDTNKTIIDSVVPSSDHFEIKDMGNHLIFLHGYSAKTSGKEATITLFDYIEKHFINDKCSKKKVKG